MTSEISACLHVSAFSADAVDPITYQADDSCRSSLVLSTLGDEKETLAGLAGPRDDGVGDSSLLVGAVGAQLLSLNGFIAEVEEALGEAKTPVRKSLLASCFCSR